MAKIVDRMPGKSRHPWEEWLDGKVRLLTRDEDFTSEPAGLVSAQKRPRRARFQGAPGASGGGLPAGPEERPRQGGC